MDEALGLRLSNGYSANARFLGVFDNGVVVFRLYAFAYHDGEKQYALVTTGETDIDVLYEGIRENNLPLPRNPDEAAEYQRWCDLHVDAAR